MTVAISVVAKVEDGKVNSEVYYGPAVISYVGGEHNPTGESIETHRLSMKVYERMINFAEQIAND